jgi:hypothetical protein
LLRGEMIWNSTKNKSVSMSRMLISLKIFKLRIMKNWVFNSLLIKNNRLKSWIFKSNQLKIIFWCRKLLRNKRSN